MKINREYRGLGPTVSICNTIYQLEFLYKTSEVNKVGALEVSVGNIISQGFLLAEDQTE